MKLMPIFTFLAWPLLGYGAVMAWYAGWWPVTVALVLGAAVCANSTILTMHEAVHFLLSPNIRWNNIGGIIAGTVTLAPLSLFRVVHQSHHGMIGTDRDLEFWPYVNRNSRRWQRVLAAFTELTVAPVYYLFMFSRALLVGHMSLRARLKCYRDVGIMVVVLGGALAIVASKGWWVPFIIAYLIPELLAANMQSWRRLTEHVGLYGDDALTLTRSVVPTNPLELFYCRVMLNENYHASHHKKASIKWTDLPDDTESLLENSEEVRKLSYGSYFQAIPQMLKELGDPRIGSQWLRSERELVASSEVPTSATI
ncbi:MAG: fatty acid desaturase [Pseudomonadota bacterium]